MRTGKTLAYNAVYRILNIALAFALTILLTRLMKAEGYGMLSLFIANIAILNLVTSFGADSGITYQSASVQLLPGKINTIIIAIVFFQLIFVLLAELIFHAATGHYWLYNSCWWLGLVYIFIVSVQEKYTALFNGHHLYSAVNKIILFCNLVMVLVFAWFYFGAEKFSAGFYIQLFIGLSLLQVLLPVVLFYTITKQKPSFLPLKKNDLKLFFSYSVITLITNCIQFLAYRVDYWFVDYYHKKEQLGIYVLAVKLAQLFWILPVLFASIIFPMVAKHKINYDDGRMLSLLRVMNVFNLLAGALAFALMPLIIPLVFGKDYSSSVQPFLYLLPGVILFCIATIMAAYFAGRNRLKVNLYGSVICFCVIIVLDIWLIPERGIIGAALASCIGYGLTAFFYMWMYLKNSGRGLKDIFIMNSDDWKRTVQLSKELFVKN
jgi:O-antigen/teichoic acid export membrane protein